MKTSGETWNIFAERFGVRLADRALAIHHVGDVAARAENRQQIALPQVVLLHQKPQNAMRRRVRIGYCSSSKSSISLVTNSNS